MQIAIREIHDGVKSYEGHRGDGQLLLQELTHRINNELASTVGIVTSMATHSDNDDVKVALAGVIEHILDFSRIYRALQMPTTDQWVDAAEYLRELCQSISIAKLQYKKIELIFLESSLQLNAFRCWRMGMIVSELVTNAARHAFYGGGGRIQVALSNRGALVECSVTDSGSVHGDFRPGQGSKIVQSLARDLNGRVRYRFGVTGTIATLSFPLVQTEPNHVDGNRLSLSTPCPR
jgi:two-component sensor histidine kinase